MTDPLLDKLRVHRSNYTGLYRVDEDAFMSFNVEGPLKLSAEAQRARVVFKPLLEQGIDVNIGATDGRRFTPAQLAVVNSLYATPRAQQQLSETAVEILRASELAGGSEPGAFNLSPTPLALATTANASNAIIPSGDGQSLSTRLRLNTESLMQYEADISDGRFDGVVNGKIYDDPIGTRDNEGDEMLNRLIVNNKLLEGGASPGAAYMASGNYISSPEFQLTTQATDYNQTAIARGMAQRGVTVPIDPAEREDFVRNAVSQISPRERAQATAVHYLNQGAAIFAETYNHPTLNRVVADGDPPRYLQAPGAVSITAVEGKPFIFKGREQPGIGLTADGTIMPLDANQLLSDFIAQELGEDLPGMGITGAVPPCGSVPVFSSPAPAIDQLPANPTAPSASP